jgi:hypothetical protein
MNKQDTGTNLTARIKKQILEAWQTGHGGNPDKVHLLRGEDGMALIIPKALYQAETDLVKREPSGGGGRVLNQYLRTLLQTVAAEFSPMIEEISEQKVAEVIPLIDLRAGWAIAFYRFAK